MNVNSLAHTKWECKYHIVFAPKYRRQVIYKDIKADVGQILGSLCVTDLMRCHRLAHMNCHQIA